MLQRFLQIIVCGSVAFSLSSCGLFSSRSSEAAVTAPGALEFDHYSNTWKPSTRVVTPPPSQPNQALAEQEEAAKRENSTLNKAGRAVTNTAGAVGRAVKKPFGWLPFGKKDEAPAEVVQPAVVPGKPAAQ